MSKVTINTSGIDKILKDMTATKIEALETLGAMVKQEAQSIVPVDTGYLREHIDAGLNKSLTFDESAGRFRDTSGRFASAKGILYIVADAPYASFVEFGTSKMAAQPFMLPAIRNNMKKLPGLFKEVLSGKLKGYSKYLNKGQSNTTVYLNT